MPWTDVRTYFGRRSLIARVFGNRRILNIKRLPNFNALSPNFPNSESRRIFIIRGRVQYRFSPLPPCILGLILLLRPGSLEPLVLFISTKDILVVFWIEDMDSKCRGH